jgi:hypothetical protein
MMVADIEAGRKRPASIFAENNQTEGSRLTYAHVLNDEDSLESRSTPVSARRMP